MEGEWRVSGYDIHVILISLTCSPIVIHYFIYVGKRSLRIRCVELKLENKKLNDIIGVSIKINKTR